MKLGILFVSIAICFAVGGIFLPFLGLLLFWWVAFAFSAAAAAYFWLGPFVLGKRQDGTIYPLTYFCFFPYYLYSWCSWQLVKKYFKEPAWNEISPGIYVGRRPKLSELPDDVDLVVDLTAEFPEIRDIRKAKPYICLPVLDGLAPPLSKQIAEMLVGLAEVPEQTLYIHCASGHGRSAVFAGAILLFRKLAANEEELVRQLKSARSTISLSNVQSRWIAQIAKYCTFP